MICYQTVNPNPNPNHGNHVNIQAAKGEPALKALMDTHTGAWAPNTGNLVDKGCRERDPAYASAFPARAVLRAKGLPWKASPGQPTWDMSQWYKGPALQ